MWQMVRTEVEISGSVDPLYTLGAIVVSFLMTGTSKKKSALFKSCFLCELDRRPLTIKAPEEVL
jgi:hypothetical protein